MEDSNNVNVQNTLSSTEDPQPVQPVVPASPVTPGPAIPASVRIARNITTTVIALAVLGFAAYLFYIGQYGIGGTIAGVVIAHYFSGVANTNTTGQIAEVMHEFTSAVSAATPQ